MKISERPPDPHIEEVVYEEEFVTPPGERNSEKRKAVAAVVWNIVDVV